ncbi:MAG: tetratricopeptide repeat protein [Candidatus Hodarchaeales archaeon]|jgi:tetratricopeptide (TPR) repeat protein
MENNLSQELGKAKSLLLEGDYNQAISILSTLINQEEFIRHLKIEGQILLIQALHSLGKYIESNLEIENTLKNNSNLELEDKIELKISKARNCWKLGNLDEGIELIKESLSEIKTPFSNNDVKQVSQLKNILGLILLDQGNFNKSLESLQESLELSEKINDNITLSMIYNNLGMIYGQKGEINESLAYFLKSLEIKKGIGTKLEIAIAFNNIGIIYRMKGELNQALEYYQQSLLLRNEIGNKKEIAASLNNIGVIYSLKGEIDLALEYHNRCLLIREKIGDKKEIAISYNNLGEIYRSKKENIKAQEYHTKSLQISREMGNVLAESEYLFNLFLATIENEQKKEANSLLMELEKISRSETIQIIRHKFLLAKALYLKTSLRAKDRGLAENILVELIKGKDIDFEITSVVIINLCELLLIELNLTELPEIINELSFHIDSLMTVAEKQKSYSLLAQGYLLKSKFTIVEDQSESSFDNSKRLLLKAKTITQEKDLNKLDIFVSNELLKIEELIKKHSNELKSFSYSDRIKVAELDNLVEQLKYKSIETSKITLGIQKIEKDELLIELCIGALTDSGLDLITKSSSCKQDEVILKSHLEYVGILYQQADNQQLFGPFPNISYGKKGIIGSYFMSFCFSAINRSISDSRIIRNGNKIPAIILMFYPKRFDQMLSIFKSEVKNLLYLNTKDLLDVSDIDQLYIDRLESSLTNLIVQHVNKP